MLVIEVVERVWHTSTLNDEEEQKIKDFIKNNSERFEFMRPEAIISEAVNELYNEDEIDLYRDTVDSDTMTEEVNWSEFEKRDANEFLDSIK